MQRDVLHIGCLVEKVINPTVLILKIKFNLKQAKQRPVEGCITKKVIGYLEFYIFPVDKNINRLYGLRCLVVKVLDSHSRGPVY